jgi:maltose O-acetyltransferase
VIGDDCGFGPYVMIHTANHRSEHLTVPIRDQGWEPGPVEIGADCFIGMGSSIVPGVRIDEGTVVGAGSVVAKDLPPYSVAVGTPARPIRRRR